MKICELPAERFFLVPGNHDINRKHVLGSQTEYFRNSARHCDQINQMFSDRDGEVKRAMERLSQYRQFVTDHYPHIALDESVSFGAWIEVNGVKLSITGLNSAWTCADNEDKNQLWLAGAAQLNACTKGIQAKSGGNAADLRIALIHHPVDWFNPQEAQQLRGRIENDFDFLLHGHAHDPWVKEIAVPYHIVIAAGAATAETEAEFGYNLVQIEPGMARVHLQRYDAKGDGWVKENIAGRVDNGIWPIQPPATFGTQASEGSTPAPKPGSPGTATNPACSSSAKGRGHFGLDAVLGQYSKKLKASRILALYGLPGVGKSVLVDELRLLPEWSALRHIQFTVSENSGLADLFGALATHLGLHDERPQPPAGTTPQAVAANLRGMAPQVAPFFLHVQRGQLWFSGGKWRREVEAIAHLLEGLVLACPGCAIVLETREQPESVTGMEACGLPKEALNDYLEHPPGLDGASWKLNKDQRSYVFQRLGGGHGRGAHGFGLFLLTRLAADKGVRPDEVLRLYADDYAEGLYNKLFRDLYQNVLNEDERNLLFACSLYRNGLHYSHLSRLEACLSGADAGAALIRRRLLTEDSDWLYLHDLAAEQARKLAVDEARTCAWQRTIAEFWLADLQGQHNMIEANIRRALEALYHLEQSGEGERINEIAPELLGRRPDEAAVQLWRLEEQFYEKKQMERACMVLEYLLKVVPDDHKAMRFLGEFRRKLYGATDEMALSLFRQAVYLDPFFPRYWANYGNAAIACGVESMRDFLIEIGNAPPAAVDEHVIAVHATALQASGQGDEASRLRMERISIGSHNAAFYADEAKYLLDDKGDPTGALAILDKASGNGCDNDFTIAIRATALQALGRGDEASRLRMEKINGGSRNSAFYADEAKYLLHDKHDPKGALAILDQARSNRCTNDFTAAIRAMALRAS